jgi:chromate transporter
MEDEVVRRRKWVTEQEFLDLVGVCNLIPGPTSTELAIYLGYVRTGWPGLILAGVLFILPASLIVLGLAWAYVRFGATPAAAAVLYGIKPVIIAIIASALWSLTRTAAKNIYLVCLGLIIMALYLLGLNPIALLLGGGILVMILARVRRSQAGGPPTSFPAVMVTPAFLAASVGALASVSVAAVFIEFLKVGAVVYGSGYVLLAFLRNDLVNRFAWLTDQQLLDAIAVGQFTPGPVFTTATFIGFLVNGLPGALAATFGIFLPSFVFIAVLLPWVPRLRSSPWSGAFLDGVNMAAVGLIAAITLQLGRAALVDIPAAALALGALVLLIRFKPNTAWLVLAGAAVGLIRSIIH